MPTIAEVRLRYATRPLWFDQQDRELARGDYALVETERGQEIGLVEGADLHPSDEEIAKLGTPLKPVIRAITEEDYPHIDELDALGHEAMPVFRELINKHELDMKPVAIDYLFTGDKAVFYFSSEERVDFRALVRDLASRLHIGIDMRQIGVRDEVRIVGGIAHCGEEFCCVRFNGEFQPVAIRMAKEQDLPLNPVKISGACGRLMCCLRYEFDTYKDFKTRAPKRGARIDTPFGPAKVTDFNTPRETIDLRLEEGGKTFTVPLACMNCEKDEHGVCKRPTSVSKEALEQSATGAAALMLTSLERFDNNLVDEVADASSRKPRQRSGRKETKDGARSGRSGEGRAQKSGDASTTHEQGSLPGRSRRRRNHDGSERSSGGQNEQGGQSTKAVQSGQGARNGQSTRAGRRGPAAGKNGNGTRGQSVVETHEEASSPESAERLRPGRRSSGVKTATSGAATSGKTASESTRSTDASTTAGTSGSKGRSRRRGGSRGRQNPSRAQGQGQGQDRGEHRPQENGRSAHGAEGAGGAGAQRTQGGGAGDERASAGNPGSTHRRRRHHAGSADARQEGSTGGASASTGRGDTGRPTDAGHAAGGSQTPDRT